MTVLKGDNLEILKTIESSIEDTWTSIEDYKEFLSVRLEECKRVLKNSGSISFIVIKLQIIILD